MDPVVQRDAPSGHAGLHARRGQLAVRMRVDRADLDERLGLPDAERDATFVLVDAAGAVMLTARPAHHGVGGIVGPDPAQPHDVVHPEGRQVADRLGQADLRRIADHDGAAPGGERDEVVAARRQAELEEIAAVRAAPRHPGNLAEPGHFLSREAGADRPSRRLVAQRQAHLAVPRRRPGGYEARAAAVRCPHLQAA